MDLQDALKGITIFTGKFPQEEIDFIRQHRDEAIPGLIEQIKYPLENSSDHESNYDQIIAMFLLSEFKENSAFPYIIEYLYMNDDDGYFWLGDVSTENLHIILANTAEAKDIDALKEVVEKTSFDYFKRSTAYNALIAMCSQGKISYDELVGYAEELTDRFYNDRDMMTVIASCEKILCSKKIYDKVIDAFDRGCIYTDYTDKNFFTSYAVIDGGIENIKNENYYSSKKGNAEDLKMWSCYKEDIDDESLNKPEMQNENEIKDLFGKLNDKRKKDILNNILNMGNRFKKERIDHIAITGEPVFKLKEILKLYTGSVLREIVKCYNIDDYSKEGREALEDKIYNTIVYEDMIIDFVNIINEDELDFAKKLSSLQKPLKIKDLAYYDILKDWPGIICVFLYRSTKYAIMPDEVKEVFNAYMQSPEGVFKENENIIIKYANAALNLYGAISADEFINILCKYRDIDLSKNKILGVLLDRFNFKTENGLHVLYNDSLKENEVFLSLLIKGILDKKPLYIPLEAKFLKYNREDYFEERRGVREFKQNMKMSCDSMERYIIDSITEEVYDFYRGKEHTPPVGVLDEYGIDFFDDDSEYMFNVMCELMEADTRKWINRGFTDREIEGKENKDGVKSKKIGRNDPCPCGSGKKYKKCCGRSL